MSGRCRSFRSDLKWATIELSLPARRRTEVPIKLAFPVGSIDDVRVRAGAFGGLRRCDGVDPEENVIQLLDAGSLR
jgi:hypothetical protein